jgi:pantetheine-phosphate adenylyltransferase
MALANQELAPEIETVSLITSKEHSFLSSTTVREIASLDGDVSSMVPPHVERTLKMYFKEYIKDKDQFATNSLRD